MTYLEAFIVPVPRDKREDYRAHAAAAAPIFAEFDVRRHYEAWADDVPHGHTTDFYRAVAAGDDEDVVVSWFEYPDRATRDAVNEKIMGDPRMEEIGSTAPFDGSRMIFGGYSAMLEEGSAPGGYCDAFVLALDPARKDDYLVMARTMADLFTKAGATRIVESLEDDVPDGKQTDFRRAVQAGEGEKVVFSFTEWPDKATRDAGWAALMENDPFTDQQPPFDGKRLFWGGFVPLLDSSASAMAEAEVSHG